MKAGLMAVEDLLRFGLHHSLINNWDVVQVRNQLYQLLLIDGLEKDDEKLFNWASAGNDSDMPETATEILNILVGDYATRGYMPDSSTTAKDSLEAAIMGILMPRQSELISRFENLQKKSPVSATDDFYKLCRAANYIQVDRIKKDIYWTYPSEYGELEITINLSKPEKDPKEIEAAKNAPPSAYPKCLLCLENVGYKGGAAWPARQNLRVIPVALNDSQWYLQYSPYAYYNEHCIVLSSQHKPMEISPLTFRYLVDFVKLFPHYFLGSNADLPIVGGSILSHEHFQGGCHVFPMQKADSFRKYSRRDYPDVEVSLVKWPLSVIRLSTAVNGEKQLIDLAAEILKKWRVYSEGDIKAFSDDTPHNTITPILSIKDGRFILDIVLRNNRTSEAYPHGIFHPREKWHHVKKENIGLIEVMGLAVLPERVKDELESGRLSEDEIGRVFVNVLKDCGVFKDDEEGRKRFDIYMRSVGFEGL